MAFSNVELYSACSPLAVNCVLYTNYQLTTTAPAGYYKVFANAVATTNSSGVITSIDTCVVYVYITADLVGTNLEQVRFRSRLDSCTGSFVSTGCQIDITYSWSDTNFQSGTSSTTIGVGSSQNIVTPSGDPIDSYDIISISFNGGSCGIYSLIACGAEV